MFELASRTWHVFVLAFVSICFLLQLEEEYWFSEGFFLPEVFIVETMF